MCKTDILLFCKKCKNNEFFKYLPNKKTLKHYRCKKCKKYCK